MRATLPKLFLAGLLAATAAAGALVLYTLWYTGSDRIIPGVSVAGQPLGGLTRTQAEQRLRFWLAPPRAGVPAPLTLTWKGQEWPLSAAPVGAPPAASPAEAALHKAWQLGRRGSLAQRVGVFARGLAGGHRLHLAGPPAGPPPVAGTPATPAAWAAELARIAAELRTEPVDATYDPDTGGWRAGEPGQELDVAATLAALQAAAATGRPRVPAVVRAVAPRAPGAAVRQAGRRLLARFETPILAADPGRVTNIALSARKISGVVLQPGEVFSFNQVVGPRTAELGWQPAKELYQGEYVLGYGGGICQVSSTLYNAVLLAGLVVVERRHHSRPLSYVEPGRDATVAWDYLDLKFRNTGPGPVAVVAGVAAGQPQRIHVSLYGNWEPEPATLEAVREEYLPPPLLESADPALPAGARIVVEQGYEGYRIKVYRVTAAGRAEVARAFYPPRAGRVLVGTGGARVQSLPEVQLR